MASEFVRWLAARPQQRWPDVGCGTGALTEAILQHAAPSAVCGVEPQPEYVSQARVVVTDRRCRFIVGEAGSLPEGSRALT
jgi:ubiquinone/menaquinone biosynthesis C-methylase UbiE